MAFIEVMTAAELSMERPLWYCLFTKVTSNGPLA